MIRTIRTFAFGILMLIILSPIILFVYLKCEVFKFKKNYKNIYRLTYIFFRSVVWSSGVTFEVKGIENLKNIEDNYLAIANHQSYFDSAIVFSALYPSGISIIAKKETRKIPIIGAYMKIMDCIFLDRDSAKAGMQMIRDANKLMEKGLNICVFPEGTRNSVENMLPFKAGVLKVATRVKKPILPITINNSFDITKYGKKITKQHVEIVIHPPVYHDEYQDYKGTELNDYIENIVKSKVF